MEKGVPLFPQKLGNYYLEEIVGQGNTCVVVKARDIHDNVFACKIISKLKFSSATNIKHFQDELAVMRTLSHPNIINLVEILQDSNNVYIFEEYCELGDLTREILRSKCIEEDRAGSIMTQVFKGLSFMHQHHIAHRDIKPENIFVCSNGLIKVADFGYSTLNSGTDYRSTVCGTLIYIAPEILKQTPYNALIADAWSCGVLLYAMVCGYLPWEKKSQAGMTEEIKFKKIEYPETMSPECRYLIEHLCDRNVDTRFSIAQAMECDFIKRHMEEETPTPLFHADPTGFRNHLSKSALNFASLREDSIVNLLNMVNRKPPKINKTAKPKIVQPILEVSSAMKLSTLVNKTKIKCRTTNIQNTFSYNQETGNFEF